ncbi:sulfurtransferase [Brachybacterium sp. EF45031]|uniref:rhodanese-like domain-containing protein n=1 Tax=Brachybacterium sillae TaxID=2810536 RepID=UPI00217E071F|nr:rhodanese-like domain-containing protein [Brachybacterium sillae]MCS6711433.1 sulfurtransferase [Brachybacterium sillae]
MPTDSPAPRRSIAEVLAAARASGPHRFTPRELQEALAGERAPLVIDIRGAHTRGPEGHIPGAVVIDHTVVEWRLDPQCPYRMDGGPGYDDIVVVVCNEGYSSSLMARNLRELGLVHATDLDGGFRGWAAAGLPVQAEPTRHVH